MKFGKSEGNAIWLSADMTSPYAFYQYFLNIEDASVITLLKVFSDPGTGGDRRVGAAGGGGALPPGPEGLGRRHGHVGSRPEAYAAVQAASEALFGKGDLATLDEHTLRDAVAELPSGRVSVGMPVVEALVAAGLVGPCNAARRPSPTGSSLNGQKVVDPEAVLRDQDFLHGSVTILRRGRKSMAAGLLSDGFQVCRGP